MKKEKAIIVDIDGTIADATHRLPLIKDGNRDWEAFFDAMVDDTYIQGSWLRVLEETEKVGMVRLPYIIFLTGRRDTHVKHTRDWLKENLGTLLDDEDYMVIMRRNGDTREDTDMKSEAYEKYIRPHFEVVMAFEDRPRIIKMWQAYGITTIPMGTGEDF